MSKPLTLLTIAAALITQFLCANAGDANWEKQRAEALNRRRLVIFNNDGDDARMFPEKLELTRENFHSLRNIGVVGSEVDSLFYSPGVAAGPLDFPNPAGEYLTVKSFHPGWRNVTMQMISEGNESMRWTEEFCRQHGIEFFASLRMNDTHDAGLPADENNPQMAKIKLKHPEYMLGSFQKRPPYATWSALDYGRPEVREIIKRNIAALCGRFDIDGIEYDFFRHMQLFRSVAWGGVASDGELETMTKFMAELRGITEAAGKKRGRPILVAVRVPDSLEYCRGVGIDLEKWMRDKLVDMVIGSGYFQLSPWRDSAELAHRCGVKFYASLDESRIREFLPCGSRNSLEAYAARALDALESGADGIYYFNIFNPKSIRAVMRGRRETLDFADKIYYATPRGGTMSQRYLRGGSKYIKTPWLESVHVQNTTPGRPWNFVMTIGDDPGSPEAREAEVKVGAIIRAGGTGVDRLRLIVNGREFAPEKRAGDLSYFSIAPDAVRRGDNNFSIAVASGEGGSNLRTILKGDALLAGANQPPWRRIWSIQGFPTVEEIVDGSYRLIDSGSLDTDCTNLLYPLVKLGGGTLRGSFEMTVEKSTAPEAAALRLAVDGRVEIITFEPGKIGLKYAKKSVDFPAGNGFHRYEFAFGAGKLLFKADGRTLFDERVVMTSDRPEGQLSGYELSVADQDSNSLIIGSLSGPGLGVSRWKNLALAEDWCTLRDFALTIRYRRVPPRVAAWKSAEPEWIAQVSAADLRKKEISPEIRSAYLPGLLEFSPDGTVLFKHEVPGSARGVISFLSPRLLKEAPEVLVFEWRIRVECEGDTEALAANLGAETPREDEIYAFFFRFSPVGVQTPWQRAKHEPLPGGMKTTDWHTYRAVIDRASGEGALWCDGKLVGSGRVGSYHRRTPPFIQFGNGSPKIQGNVRFDCFRAGAAK